MNKFTNNNSGRKIKLRSNLSLVITLGFVTFVTGCMSARDGRVLQKDIFEVNTRLVVLENSLKKTGKISVESSKNTNLRQANSTARVDKVERDLQLIRGDIDSLKVGVKTGKLPGMGDEDVSVGMTIESMTERLAKIEETQAELIAILEKRGSKKSKKKSAASNGRSERKSLRRIADFRKAFSQKKYKHIVADIDPSIKVNKGNVKKELYYFQAESLFKLGNLGDAAIKFNQFIEKYKKGRLATKSRIRMGDCYRHLGDQETALIYYNEALSAKPTSEDAKSVKAKIAKLKS